MVFTITITASQVKMKLGAVVASTNISWEQTKRKLEVYTFHALKALARRMPEVLIGSKFTVVWALSVLPSSI